MFNFFKKHDKNINPTITQIVKTEGSIGKKGFDVDSSLKRNPTSRPDSNPKPTRGMWVASNTATSYVGILTNLEPGDIATVMQVDTEEGTNVLEVHVPASALRQAYFEEIPAKRRPELDRAKAFGYISQFGN